MNDSTQTFLQRLRRQTWIWRSGTLLSVGLRVARVAVILLVVFAWLDGFLALSNSALLALDLAMVTSLVFVGLWGLISAFGHSPRDSAARADQLIGNCRQPVLSAWELISEKSSSVGEWQQFLVERSLQTASQALSSLSNGKVFPWPDVGRETRKMLIAIAIAGASYVAQPQAVPVVLSRLFHPQSELPPYSRYQFVISPDPARVVYGGSLALNLQITGSPVRQPVRLWTRTGEANDLASCVSQDATHFSQRLEKVVDPVEFCFVVGRARSPWRKVEILLQPKVALAKLCVDPPDYTRLAPAESVLSQDNFEGYKRSRVRLQLTSNRPLARGTLTLIALGGTEATRTVRGESAGLHTLAFDWELNYPARLEFQLEDVQGTPMAEPLRLTQKLLPDRPPEVAMQQPPPYVLATPTTRVQLRGEASDDLGLARVDLIRTVAGYRDRSIPAGSPSAERQFVFQDEVDLASLGVLAGQVLELSLEARDFNPDQTGIGASDLVRIEIISDTEYGEILRARETLDQFQERYRRVTESMEELRRTVDELSKEAAKPQSDAVRIDQLLDQARAQNEQMGKYFRQLAAEFPAFALENGWSEVLKDLADQSEKRANQLAGLKASSSQLGETMNKLRQDLDLDAQRVAKPEQLTADFLKAGRVAEQPAAFLQILNRQRQLVRQLERQPFEQARLAAQAEEQAAILRDLGAFTERLNQVARELPEEGEFADLRRTALEFTEKVRECQAESWMKQAEESARKDDSANAGQYARLAKEKLEELLSSCENSAFGGLCRGSLKFQVREDLRASLQQLLAALASRGQNGSGGQTGLGSTPGGGEGDASSGFSMPGQSRLNTPVMGPPRSLFTLGGRASGNTGQGGSGAGQSIQENGRETGAGTVVKDASGTGRSPELVPEKYRKALQNYFSKPEVEP